jgi:AcrR family transcriptional regulator
VTATARGPAGPAARLPRGRHGLPREAVADSQRVRILTAMIAVVAARGYAATRVVDVISTAGVSRKTFYELFDSKEDCFLAAYDILLGRALEEAQAGFGVRAEVPWPERIESALGALLGHLAAYPAEARFALVEVLAAGPKALARRDSAMRQFAGFIEVGRAESGVDLPVSTAQTVAGGIAELLYSEVLHGAAEQLPARVPELVFLIVLPFLGAERAAAERDRAGLA